MEDRNEIRVLVIRTPPYITRRSYCYLVFVTSIQGNKVLYYSMNESHHFLLDSLPKATLLILLIPVLSCRPTTKNEPPSQKEASTNEPILCEQPGELSYSLQLTDSLVGQSSPDEYHDDGPMVAVWDIDRDGLSEILYCFPDEEITYLYQQNELSVLKESCFGPMLITDIDNDGWLDFVFENYKNDEVVIEIWKNDQGTLSPRSYFSLEFNEIVGLRAADFNNDNHTDLLLLRNSVDGIISNQDVIALWVEDWSYEINTELLDPLLANRKSFDASTLDINMDGWTDIYIGNDRGGQHGGNVLWWNRQGSFEAADESCGCTPTQESMGIDIADFNHDGLYDILSSDTHKTYLFMGIASEEFVDVSAAMHANVMDSFEMTWGVRFADIDNDGKVELLQAQGDLYYPGQINPEHVGPMSFSISTQIDGQFVEIQDEIGLTVTGSFRSVIPFHWNKDGVLDLLITDTDQAPLLYVSNNCTLNNYIYFTGKEGTKVRFSGGDQSFVGELHTGSSFSASQDPLLHFGLGDLEHIENVEVQYRGEGWSMLYETLQVPQHIVLENQN
jgi:hypothetical protein